MLYLVQTPRKHISVGILGGMLWDEELEAQKLFFARSQPCVPDVALTMGSVMIFVKMRRSCKPKDLS